MRAAKAEGRFFEGFSDLGGSLYGGEKPRPQARRPRARGCGPGVRAGGGGARLQRTLWGSGGHGNPAWFAAASTRGGQYESTTGLFPSSFTVNHECFVQRPLGLT